METRTEVSKRIEELMTADKDFAADVELLGRILQN